MGFRGLLNSSVELAASLPAPEESIENGGFETLGQGGYHQRVCARGVVIFQRLPLGSYGMWISGLNITVGGLHACRDSGRIA